MLFNGSEDWSLELKIANYQFLNIYDEDFDSSWLNIYIDVKSKMGHWQTVDPSLMIGEFKELIEWFKDLSEDRPVSSDYLAFTEPDLQFDLLENTSYKKKVRISF